MLLTLLPWWLIASGFALVLLAWLSVGVANRFLRLYRGQRHVTKIYEPFVTVIVPFKGADDDLPANIQGLCEQDLPDYELLLVVESEQDPAYPILQRELAKYPNCKSRIVVAGQAGKHEGQKVHNQLFALSEIYDTARDEDVWVFADSDAVPGSDWLRRLINPLRSETFTVLTTGYRWLIPQEPQTFWSQMASVVNSSAACLLGDENRNYAWGGSMALRARAARNNDLRGLLEGALCDDYQFTRMARRDGRRIYFVPQCLVAAPVRYNFSSFTNFAHRQHLLTRVYAPQLFATALGITSLYVFGFYGTLAGLIYALIAQNYVAAVFAGVALALAHIAHQMRSTLRRRIIVTAFGEEALPQLRTTLRWDRWGTPVWMTLHWLLLVRALFGRTMNWRGILYRLDAPQKCTRLSETST